MGTRRASTGWSSNPPSSGSRRPRKNWRIFIGSQRKTPREVEWSGASPLRAMWMNHQEEDQASGMPLKQPALKKRALYRKAVSMGDGMADNANLWQSKESVGSNESLASNASIPLPIPVRTRSARGGSESGYSSDTYNAMTIKRLERDTSVDRLSTGSRESMQSTQSEWLPGEKKKSKGLIGKLKNAVKKDRNISEEREFGSGSDISSASVQSKQSTSSKMST